MALPFKPITVRHYLESLYGFEMAPLSLATLLKPFGLTFASRTDNADELWVGLVLDDLAEAFGMDDWIDPIDVAISASSVGLAEADAFFAQVPALFHAETMQ